MDKLIIPLIVCILLVGGCFYMFNSGSGINTGVNNGSLRVHNKVTDFDYSGSVAPGSGQTLPTGN
ncbi:hypothetical protein ACLBWT_18690 [Paenibacillus sp. D51F]